MELHKKTTITAHSENYIGYESIIDQDQLTPKGKEATNQTVFTVEISNMSGDLLTYFDRQMLEGLVVSFIKLLSSVYEDIDKFEFYKISMADIYVLIGTGLIESQLKIDEIIDRK